MVDDTKNMQKESVQVLHNRINAAFGELHVKLLLTSIQIVAQLEPSTTLMSCLAMTAKMPVILAGTAGLSATCSWSHQPSSSATGTHKLIAADLLSTTYLHVQTI